MKRLSLCVAVVIFLAFGSFAHAYVYVDNFSTSWSGSYAPGWGNEEYRWGTAPVAVMEQVTFGGRTAAKVIVTTADSTQWWGIIHNTNVNIGAMDKQFNPYMKVSYYDEGATNRAGQLYAVPTTTIPPDDDWTDVQFGTRLNQAGNYFFHAASMVDNPPWTDTGVARTPGWHDLMFQLSSADGKLHFYLDGAEVGTSERSDYTNLGTVMLATFFNEPLGAWGTELPYAIFSNVEVGSDSPVPVPPSLLLLAPGLLGLAGWRRFKK